MVGDRNIFPGLRNFVIINRLIVNGIVTLQRSIRGVLPNGVVNVGEAIEVHVDEEGVGE